MGKNLAENQKMTKKKKDMGSSEWLGTSLTDNEQGDSSEHEGPGCQPEAL